MFWVSCLAVKGQRTTAPKAEACSEARHVVTSSFSMCTEQQWSESFVEWGRLASNCKKVGKKKVKRAANGRALVRKSFWLSLYNKTTSCRAVVCRCIGDHLSLHNTLPSAELLCSAGMRPCSAPAASAWAPLPCCLHSLVSLHRPQATRRSASLPRERSLAVCAEARRQQGTLHHTCIQAAGLLLTVVKHSVYW